MIMMVDMLQFFLISMVSLFPLNGVGFTKRILIGIPLISMHGYPSFVSQMNDHIF
jgi:hypothetical protein